MIKYFLMFSFALACLAGELCGQNLAPNGSFEAGPGVQCGVFSVGDFNSSVSNWTSPTGGTPAIFSTQVAQSCWNFQPNSTFSGPPCLPGSQLPQTGDAQAGILVRGIMGQQRRDYIQVQLSQAMVAGRCYRVAFSVSFADSSQYSSSNIGALLSVNAPTATSDTVIEAAPQFEAASIVTNAAGWTLIQGELQVNQAFRFLTIGNFFRDEDTDSLLNPNYSGQSGCEGSYYFVDDVEVYEICPKLDRLGDRTLCLGDSVTLSTSIPGNYPASAIEYLWTNGATTSEILVMDQGHYGVRVTVNDTCILGDTAFVDVNMCPPTLDMANVFSPNGDDINDIFKPVTFTRIQDATLMIFDRWGKKMYESNDLNAGWDGNLNDRPVPEGVYYWTVRYRGISQLFDRESGNLTLVR
jgi:gliding motility-associated-like protein